MLELIDEDGTDRRDKGSALEAVPETQVFLNAVDFDRPWS